MAIENAELMYEYCPQERNNTKKPNETRSEENIIWKEVKRARNRSH